MDDNTSAVYPSLPRLIPAFDRVRLGLSLFCVTSTEFTHQTSQTLYRAGHNLPLPSPAKVLPILKEMSNYFGKSPRLLPIFYINVILVFLEESCRPVTINVLSHTVFETQAPPPCTRGKIGLCDLAYRWHQLFPWDGWCSVFFGGGEGLPSVRERR